MAFSSPELLIAGLAAIFLLLSGLGLFALRRQRHAPAPKPKTPKRKTSKLEAGPIEEEPAAAAPQRRRQLHSFAEAEREHEPEAILAMPQLHTTPDLPELEAVETQAEVETEAEAADFPDADPVAYDQAVLLRLEDAFEALQAGDISLDDYRARILAEEQAVDRRIAELAADGDPAELEAALVAQESVRWCRDWADEQAGDNPA